MKHGPARAPMPAPTPAPAQQPLHFRHWPAGVPHAAPPPRFTLAQALAASAAQAPDKAAVIYNGHTTTYAQLQQRSHALAGFLQQRLGVQPGDRVLLVGQNCPQWVQACYAVLRAGAVVVPVSPMCKPAELAFHAADSDARVALVSQDLWPGFTLGEAAGQVGAAVVWAPERPQAEGAQAEGAQAERAQAEPAPREATRGEAEALEAARGEGPAETVINTVMPVQLHRWGPDQTHTRVHDFDAAIAASLSPGPIPTDPDALAVLPYTSGTTGQPKGCMHSHATLLASLASSAVWKRLHRGSVVLTVAPLFHMLGLQNGMNLPLLLGATAVMMPRWHAATAAQLMERHRVSAWSAPPAMVLDLFSHADTPVRDLSALRFLSGGGAAMPEAVAAMLQQRHGLQYEEAYGLTETASFLHANPPQRCKPQCLGIPTQGVDSRIIDPDTLAELPHGAVGELVTHAPQVMRGYWRREAATEQAFVTLGGQRFFRTGDLAWVDDDGYFFLKDRLKRMINVSGYKVWPAEVESMLYAHPAVHEACVIAVPDQRAGRLGEAVKALVVLKPAFQGQLQASQFLAWCREHMAVYKAPREVEFVPALPKSAAGKVLWRELQQAHQEQSDQKQSGPGAIECPC